MRRDECDWEGWDTLFPVALVLAARRSSRSLIARMGFGRAKRDGPVLPRALALLGFNREDIGSILAALVEMCDCRFL